MKPYLLLAVALMAGCAFGQSETETFRMDSDDWRKCHGAVAHDKDGYYCAIRIEAPEPMDVPAIKIGEAQCVTLKSDCGDSFCMPNSVYMPGSQICTEEKWTCKKGSGRTLLEDVDEHWHCIKFPAQVQP